MELIWDGKYDADGRRVEPPRIAYALRTTAVFGESDSGDAGNDGSEEGPSHRAGWRNRLILGDNRYVLPSLLPEFAGKVNLAYLDPPFATGSAFSPSSRPRNHGGERTQAAFRDNWGRDLGRYLQWLTQQLVLVRELLHETGSLYLHLDWRAVAYVRAAADEVFGPTFRSCIIWSYGGRGAKSAAGQFPRNHDQILVYSRGRHFTYHPATREKRTPVGSMAAAGYQFDDEGRPYKTAPRGDYTDESVERLQEHGRITRTRRGSVRVRYFVRREGDEIVEDQVIGDVWTDIPDAMHLPVLEKTGYPTQKPERLLERIIMCSTDPGDLVLDCFCGSGVSAAVAETLCANRGERASRRWIACDTGELSIHTAAARILGISGHRPFVVQDLGEVERTMWARDLATDPAALEPAPAASSGSNLDTDWRRRVIRSFGGKWIGCDPVHGVRGERLLHVGPLHGKIDGGDIEAICAAAATIRLPGSPPRRLDILGWEFGPDAAHAVAEPSTEMTGSAGFAVRLVQIPRQIMDRRALRRASAFMPLLPVQLGSRQEGRTVILSLTGSGDPEHSPGSDPDQREPGTWLNRWAIDWHYNGQVFRCGWHSERKRSLQKWAPPDLEARQAYLSPGVYHIMAKVVDVRDVECSVSVTVRVE